MWTTLVCLAWPGGLGTLARKRNEGERLALSLLGLRRDCDLAASGLPSALPVCELHRFATQTRCPGRSPGGKGEDARA